MKKLGFENELGDVSAFPPALLDLSHEQNRKNEAFPTRLFCRLIQIMHVSHSAWNRDAL